MRAFRGPRLRRVALARVMLLPTCVRGSRNANAALGSEREPAMLVGFVVALVGVAVLGTLNLVAARQG